MKKLNKLFLTTTMLTAALAFGLAACNDSTNGINNPAGKPAATESFADAVETLSPVNGFPGVYTVEFDGEYKLNDAFNAELKTAADLLNYLNQNVTSWKTAKEFGAPLTINVQGAACSSIVAENANEGATGYIYGRNFDWAPDSSLIVHTMPDTGYEAVSTCYLYFLTNKENWAPTSDIEHDAAALGAIYVPMDGMNEKGLYIANLNDDITATASKPISDNPDKKNIQTTVAIRYILDNAATVDEALSFLKTVDMYPVYAEEDDPDNGKKINAYHFAIADNTGKSVVAEWISGELKVTETKVVTNFNISNTNGDTEGKCYRFDTLTEVGKTNNWKMTTAQVTEALKDVQQSNSVWSAVFEPCEKRVTYYFRKQNEGGSLTNISKNEIFKLKKTLDVIDYTKPLVVQF